PKVITKTTVTNRVSGEYIILPTNFCEATILAVQLTNVVIDTNFLGSATNVSFTTNANGLSVSNVQFAVLNQIDYSTNHTFVVFPTLCLGTNISMNQGIENVKFVRRDFDSLSGTFFYPLTNEYVLNSVTNPRVVPLRVRRTVTAPDIVFSADDLVTDP